MRVELFTLVVSIGFALAACTPTSSDDDDMNEECEECLDSGGTWQPEAGECTQDCEIMDISCYTESCPGDCSDDCSYCFSSSDCEDAGCTWHAEGETMWCAG